jgi:hypothetical protein
VPRHLAPLFHILNVTGSYLGPGPALLTDFSYFALIFPGKCGHFTQKVMTTSFPILSSSLLIILSYGAIQSQSLRSVEPEVFASEQRQKNYVRFSTVVELLMFDAKKIK